MEVPTTINKVAVHQPPVPVIGKHLKKANIRAAITSPIGRQFPAMG
jgi:hypothetical protein